MTAPNWHTHVRGLRIDQALDLLLPLGTIKCVRIAQRDGVPVVHSTGRGARHAAGGSAGRCYKLGA